MDQILQKSTANSIPKAVKEKFHFSCLPNLEKEGLELPSIFS